MRIALPFALLGVLALVSMQCENRLPTEEESGMPSAESLMLIVDAEDGVIAQVDTVRIAALLVDSNMNVVSDTAGVPMRARHGLLLAQPMFGGLSMTSAEYLYFYPYAVDTIQYDTLTAWHTRPEDRDTLWATTVITIRPQQGSVGYLQPAYINVSVRTDSVYKSGAGWKMFVDADVSDPLGNPVKGSFQVLFTFEESGIDTSLVSLANLAVTGERVCIGNACTEITGEAVTILTFDSRAISDTVVIRATVVDKSAISAVTRLELPLPSFGLKLEAHDNNSETMIVRAGRSDTASILVTLRDAFNYAVAGRYVKVTAKPGIVLPLCPVRDNAGAVVGSQDCSCDTVFADTCLVRDPLSPAVVIDTVCKTHTGFLNCAPLPYISSGITNAQGEFYVRIVVNSGHSTDPDAALQEVVVELEERVTHVRNLDFKLPVIFQ